MNKLKGAILGLGKMGISHAAIVGAHPMVDMVAVCDTSALVLEAFRKFSKVRKRAWFFRIVDIQEI